MHHFAPLVLLLISLSTSIAASAPPHNNLHARDGPAKTPIVPPLGAPPGPPPEAAQNNGGDASPADDSSDSGDDGGLEERNLDAREAYAGWEDELYVRDEEGDLYG
ncbi:hypothetical protein MMC18_007260 [Xylographa bjoerkii]|nr:hypothetical protein [Xylographa bjoerkii]